MKHPLRLPILLLTLIALAMPSLFAQAPGQAPAQGPPPFRMPPWPAWSTEKVTDDLFVIIGGAGNTTALLTDEGVVLVDSKFAENSDELQTRLKALTDKPVKYIFNTHAHGDHSGGNIKFMPAATAIAHANARAAMVQGKQPGPPQITYTDAITVNLGGKEVTAHYYGRAHTNGDSWVYFPAQKVLAAGDSFNNGTGTGGTGGSFGLLIAPGGSIIDITKTLDEVLKLDFNVVVPGHGPLATKTELTKWRAEVEQVRNRIRTMVREGKSKADVTKMLVDEFKWPADGPAVAISVEPLMNALK